MKRKRVLYLALILAGAALIAAVYWQRNSISSRWVVTWMGAASAMTGIGFSRLLSAGMEAADPSLERRNRIEQRGERNVAIRNRAKALSGYILQWAVIAASWLAFGLGAPAWIVLLALASLILKCLLELFLTVRYRNQM